MGRVLGSGIGRSLSGIGHRRSNATVRGMAVMAGTGSRGLVRTRSALLLASCSVQRLRLAEHVGQRMGRLGSDRFINAVQQLGDTTLARADEEIFKGLRRRSRPQGHRRRLGPRLQRIPEAAGVCIGVGMECFAFADRHALERVDECQVGVILPGRSAARVGGRRHVGGERDRGDIPCVLLGLERCVQLQRSVSVVQGVDEGCESLTNAMLAGSTSCDWSSPRIIWNSMRAGVEWRTSSQKNDRSRPRYGGCGDRSSGSRDESPEAATRPWGRFPAAQSVARSCGGRIRIAVGRLGSRRDECEL